MNDFDHIDDFLNGFDGLKLHYEGWIVKNPLATIVVSHGFAEHSGRYAHFGQYFAKKGYNVYVMDHRGHGKSDGSRGYVNKFDDFIKDLDEFIKLVKEKEGIDKVFLIGHSMGGLIALRYAIFHPENLKGVITSGAALIPTVNISSIMKKLAKLMSKIAPKAKISSKIDPSILTHDEAIWKKYAEDPLVFKFSTTRLGAELFDAGEDTLKRAKDLKIPIMMLSGSEDKLVDPKGSKKFIEEVPIEDKKLIIYPGLYHEIFNELEREKVFNDVIDWIKVHM